MVRKSHINWVTSFWNHGQALKTGKIECRMEFRSYIIILIFHTLIASYDSAIVNFYSIQATNKLLPEIKMNFEMCIIVFPYAASNVAWFFIMKHHIV